MAKFLPGVTHAIVRMVTNAETMNAADSLIALVLLCFTEDKDYILVRINKMKGPVSGVTASLPGFSIMYNGKLTPLAGIRGGPADEAKVLALVAFDKVKQKFGLKFGKHYKVFAKDIQDITMGGTNASPDPGLGNRPTA